MAKKIKIALGIEYDGSCYFGWQHQRDVNSIQACLERALSKVANQEIHVFCAGRTDAKVHACGQVIHFETTAHRTEKAWLMGGNAHLPKDIAIQWVLEVDDTFHARFSATARRYRYIIYNQRHRSALLNQCIAHYYLPIDAQKMHIAAQCLAGEHDFSAFRAAQCQSRTPYRCVKHINIESVNNYIIIDIKANAFVHHMVRNIVGSLLEVGYGHKPVSWINQLLQAKDRTLAGATAKPEGLYLVSVDYPLHYGLPKLPVGPSFLTYF